MFKKVQINRIQNQEKYIIIVVKIIQILIIILFLKMTWRKGSYDSL